MNVSEVAIEGSHLSAVPELLRKHGYEIERTTTVDVRALEAILGDFERSVVVSYVEDGWTHIFEPEMTLTSNDELWRGFTRDHPVPVLGWLIGSTSNTLGLWSYRAGELQPEVLAVDGDLTEKGRRLPEEDGIDWSAADEPDLLGILERLGAPYQELRGDVEYHVYDVTG